MPTTKQIEAVLDRFKDTEEEGAKICTKRPPKYSHEKFSEILSEAIKQKMIKGWYCLRVNSDRTYHCTIS